METECDLEMDILILRAARQILRNSKDFLLEKIEQHNKEYTTLKRRLQELEKLEEEHKDARESESSDEDKGKSEEKSSESEGEEIEARNDHREEDFVFSGEIRFKT